VSSCDELDFDTHHSTVDIHHSMKLYPAFLSLSGRQTLVIGSSPRALRRAKGLIDGGAKVTLVDPDAPTEIPGITTVCQREFLDEDLHNCWLVICASTNDSVNTRIAALCEQRRIFCNVVNEHGSATFSTPAVVDRAPLQIAISTAGVAPVLTRVIKAKLETLIPSSHSRLAKLIGRFQEPIQRRIPQRALRSQYWNRLISSPVAELASQVDEQHLERILEEATRADKDSEHLNQQGFVSLVGAGPGDPDLLTFRALRLIQATDILVYDRLVSPAILDLCREDTQLIYAGKAKSDHAIPQNSINQLLVDLALSGKNVVRLKGGDPFIFGRGGEEIETLAQHRIQFQVVPGITAASGCAAFSGIPLTHRDHAQSCVFVTGHLQNGNINLDWQHLKDPSQTIVVYMGLTGLTTICQTLIKYGRSPHTPAALIEQGTTPSQKVHTGTLENLPDLIESGNVRAPTLLIIGSVVSLREKLGWFETDHLAG